MFKFLCDLTEVAVKTAALPVAVVIDSTCIPMIVADKTLTGEVANSLEKSINELGNTR